jgi:hypothetical protein
LEFSLAAININVVGPIILLVVLLLGIDLLSLHHDLLLTQIVVVTVIVLLVVLLLELRLLLELLILNHLRVWDQIIFDAFQWWQVAVLRCTSDHLITVLSVEGSLRLHLNHILHKCIDRLWWVSRHSALHLLLLLLLHLQVIEVSSIVQRVAFHPLLLAGVGRHSRLRFLFVLNFRLINISRVWIWLVLVLKKSLPLEEILSLWLALRLHLLLALLGGRVYVLLDEAHQFD